MSGLDPPRDGCAACAARLSHEATNAKCAAHGVPCTRIFSVTGSGCGNRRLIATEWKLHRRAAVAAGRLLSCCCPLPDAVRGTPLALSCVVVDRRTANHLV